MAARILIYAALLVQACGSRQDEALTSLSAGIVEFENDNLRIVRFRFHPRESIRRHDVHPQAAVLFTDYAPRWTAADGQVTEFHGKAGQTMWTPGGNYSVQLLNDGSAELLAVQLKDQTEPAATGRPLLLNPKGDPVEFENRKIRILRLKTAPRGQTAIPGFAQSVAIPLAAGEIQFMRPDGQTESRRLKAGEFVWKPGGVVQVDNLGDKPMELILIQVAHDAQLPVEE